MTYTFYVRRAVIALCSLILISILLMIRLYCLTFNNAEALEVLSGQYTRKNTVARHDGFVYDSEDRLLSHKLSGAIAVVNPVKASGGEAAGYLADHCSHSFEEISRKLSDGLPFTVMLESVPEARTPDGVYLYEMFSESENNLCRHLLGYRDYDGNAVTGIYKVYEDVLDSYSGSLSYSYTADAVGKALRDGSFFVEDRFYGDDGGIMLTVNGDLQKKVDEICDESLKMGAVIISEISTGNILALSSRPLYDSNDVGKYLDSSEGELINRAFSLYTPGSVFKAVVAASALEKDEQLYELEYECTGYCNVSGKRFNCHKKNGHGVQTMKEAFANSCNTYFINLLQHTGFDYTLTVCNRMGLGSSNAIDGFLTDGAKLPDMTKKYPDAYKANFAFGQGELLLSCIDVLNIYSVCSGGFKCDFSLVKGIKGAYGEEDVLFEPKEKERVLSENTVIRMREMMYECVENGTGRAADSDKTVVGGKTATAQSGQYKKGEEVLHRWFAGAFPIDAPRYTVVVLCDGNGENNGNPQKIFSECVSAVTEICYY